MVKFRFPNKHDVYMHDTTERQLFTQSTRALSHGCIRVQNPRRFAEVLLEAGNDYSEAKVANTIAGGGEITLEHQIPVHMTYFTAMVDDTGRVSTFSDIYGHDSRLSAALTGRALKLESAIETSSADIDGGDPYASCERCTGPESQEGQAILLGTGIDRRRHHRFVQQLRPSI